MFLLSIIILASYFKKHPHKECDSELMKNPTLPHEEEEPTSFSELFIFQAIEVLIIILSSIYHNNELTNVVLKNISKSSSFTLRDAIRIYYLYQGCINKKYDKKSSIEQACQIAFSQTLSSPLPMSKFSSSEISFLFTTLTNGNFALL